MAKRISNLKNIVVVQFIHILIFAYAFSIILGVFVQNTGGLALIILWWMIPIFIIELLLVVMFKGKAIDIALPLVSIFVFLLPAILQGINQSISFEVISNCIVSGATIVTILSLYLLLTNFGRANKLA